MMRDDLQKLLEPNGEQRRRLFCATTIRLAGVDTLSEAFHREIDQHQLPVEREAIACLAHPPGSLDFYI